MISKSGVNADFVFKKGYCEIYLFYEKFCNTKDGIQLLQFKLGIY